MGGLSREQLIQIERLQRNLSALRRIAGWTMEELGNRIGVTKQTISNLEKNGKMTLTQYLAIRSVLDYEAAWRIQKDKNDTLLFFAICRILDKNLDDDEQEDAENNVAMLALAIAGKAPDSQIRKLDTAISAKIENPDAIKRLYEMIEKYPEANKKIPDLILSFVLGTVSAEYMGKLFGERYIESHSTKLPTGLLSGATGLVSGAAKAAGAAVGGIAKALASGKQSDGNAKSLDSSIINEAEDEAPYGKALK